MIVSYEFIVFYKSFVSRDFFYFIFNSPIMFSTCPFVSYPGAKLSVCSDEFALVTIAPGCDSYFRPNSLINFSTWPAAFTFFHSFTIFPFCSTKNVDLIVHWISFPYIFFSPHTQNCLCRLRSSSDSRSIVRHCFSIKLLWDFSESLLIQTIPIPFLLKMSLYILKSCASIVHPGVLSLG
jgi:hypothetical protein